MTNQIIVFENVKKVLVLQRGIDCRLCEFDKTEEVTCLFILNGQKYIPTFEYSVDHWRNCGGSGEYWQKYISEIALLKYDLILQFNENTTCDEDLINVAHCIGIPVITMKDLKQAAMEKLYGDFPKLEEGD